VQCRLGLTNHRFVVCTCLAAKLSFRASGFPPVGQIFLLSSVSVHCSIPYCVYENMTLHAMFISMHLWMNIYFECLHEREYDSEVLWFVSSWWWVDSSSPPALNPPDLTDFPPYFLISCFHLESSRSRGEIYHKLHWSPFCNGCLWTCKKMVLVYITDFEIYKKCTCKSYISHSSLQVRLASHFFLFF